MKMKHAFAKAAFVAAVVGGVSAQAARLGHPGYSAKGATAAQNQWNILADPTDAESGSTSVIYPRGVAGLAEVDAEPGFEITEINIVLEHNVSHTDFTFSSGAVDETTFVPSPEDLEDPGYSNPSTYLPAAIQPGYLQVFWQATGGTTDSDPNGDVDDFDVLFNNLTTDPNEQATFTVYADPGTAEGGQFVTPDSYTDNQGNTYSASDINIADDTDGDNVVVDLPVAVPEPGAPALLGCSAMGLLLVRRRRPASA
jgi:hypothetical protein